MNRVQEAQRRITYSTANNFPPALRACEYSACPDLSEFPLICSRLTPDIPHQCTKYTVGGAAC